MEDYKLLKEIQGIVQNIVKEEAIIMKDDIIKIRDKIEYLDIKINRINDRLDMIDLRIRIVEENNKEEFQSIQEENNVMLDILKHQKSYSQE